MLPAFVFEARPVVPVTDAVRVELKARLPFAMDSNARDIPEYGATFTSRESATRALLQAASEALQPPSERVELRPRSQGTKKYFSRGGDVLSNPLRISVVS